MRYFKSLAWFWAGMALLSSSVFAGGTADQSHMKIYTAKGKFEEVKENIVFAINGKGLVINNVSHIGEMLDRTGKDLGLGKQVYLKAEALEFCSATVSRKMMEADPHNIVFCPYIIAVYVLPSKPDTVYISYRRPTPVGTPASRAALKEVENLLDDIIKEAI